jgi:phosphoserine phosphatase
MALSVGERAARVRLVAFDLDGTLVRGTVFIWQTLHERFGTDPARRQKAREDFLAGRSSYADWFRSDLELLAARGATRERILECFAGLEPAPGARETLQALASRGYRLAVISGSLDVLLEHHFPGHPFRHVFINRLVFHPDGRIAGGEATPYDLEGKADGLRALARQEGLGLAECAFVGDHVNDLEALAAAGLGVAVNVKDERVARAAHLVLPGHDLRALLEILPGPGRVASAPEMR